MNYSGYKIDHQTNSIPLIENQDSNIFFSHDFPFLFNKTTYQICNSPKFMSRRKNY